jgi:phosphoribosylformylglycinamidine synthase
VKQYIIFEASETLDGFHLLGHTQAEPTLTWNNETIPLDKLRADWESPLESIFPVKIEQSGTAPLIHDDGGPARCKGTSIARPKAVIPVLPSTNGEYDTALAIERAGGTAETILIRNLTPEMLQASMIELEKAIRTAQMLIFPGGGEVDGLGKYIISLFQNARLADAVSDLLQNRDGLVLGIGNGFQALLKLGLLTTAGSPTLTFNRIGRHQSRYVTTRVSSVASPWLSRCTPGELYVQPISCGEGRFTASEEDLKILRTNGQIVFQYADKEGVPSMDIAHNSTGSDWAVEGLCSALGRVLGKMAHSERCGEHVAKNILGNKHLPLFEGGVGYFQE